MCPLPASAMLDLCFFLSCLWPSPASCHQPLSTSCSFGDWRLPYLLYRMLGRYKTVLCSLNGIVQPGGVWAGPCLRASKCQEPSSSMLALEG